MFTDDADDILRLRAGNTVAGRQFNLRRLCARCLLNVRIHHTRKTDRELAVYCPDQESRDDAGSLENKNVLERQDAIRLNRLLYRRFIILLPVSTCAHLTLSLASFLPFHLIGRIVLIRGVEFASLFETIYKKFVYIGRITKQSNDAMSMRLHTTFISRML